MIRTTGGELQIVGTAGNATGSGNASGGMCWCKAGAVRQYGIWKLRARFDAGAGYAPVIGLWPYEGDADAEGWITVAKVAPASRTSAYHLVRGPGDRSLEGSLTADLTGWHTYTIEWRPTFVRMYLDDKVFLDTTTSGTPVNIPTAPMDLYIQQEVGPNGSVEAPNAATRPRSSCTSTGSDTSVDRRLQLTDLDVAPRPPAARGRAATVLRGAHVVIPGGVLPDGWVRVERRHDHRGRHRYPAARRRPAGGGRRLAPAGFVDLHMHGGGE